MHLYIASFFFTICIGSATSAMKSVALAPSTKENSADNALEALKKSGILSPTKSDQLIPELHQEGMVWIQQNTAIVRVGGEKLDAAVGELFKENTDRFFSVMGSANFFKIDKLISSFLLFLKKELGLHSNALFLRAAASGRQDALKVFLDAGVNINCTDDNGRTAVILATQGNHVETVKALHDHRADLDVQDNKKKTALHYATADALKSRQPHPVAAYLAQHASPDQQDEQGTTSLMMFARGSSYDEHLPVIETCLRRTRNPNLRDSEDNTALTIAIDKGREQVVLLMIRYLDVNAPGRWGRTPLMESVTKNERIVEALLEKGARLDGQDQWGETALILACDSFSRDDKVQLFLEKNASIIITNKKGETALMKAVKCNSKAGQALIKKGAKTDVVDHAGKTVLMHAASGWSPKNVQLALDHGGKAVINEKDKEGNTALTHAIKCIHTEQSIQIIRLLLQHGATIDLSEALTVAVETFEKEKVELVVELGADIRARDKDGATVLVRLVKQERNYYSDDRKKYAAMVEFLLGKGVDVDEADNTGMTALMYSAKRCDGAGLENILQHKTERTVNARGPRSETALMMTNREETIKLLLQHAADPRIAADKGDTALSNTWSKAVAQALLDHDPSLDMTAAVRKATEYDREELLDFFLSRGAKISSSEVFRKAICKGKHKAAAKILASAPDKLTLINQRNDKNESILVELFKQIKEQSSWQRSSDEDILACITLLLNEGVQIDAADNEGTTALMRAVQLPESVRLPAIKLLLSKKTNATVNAQDTSGRTVLMLAVEHTKNVELCSELVAQGAVITATCTNPGYLNNGWNVLAYAMPYGSAEDSIPLIRYFLERAPELDVTEAMNRAMYCNKPELVAVLMELSTQWNPATLFFECAQKKGWKSIVEKLLDEKKIVDVDITNDAGNSALWYAVGNRYTCSWDRKIADDTDYDQELITLLLERGAKKDIVRALGNIMKQNAIATAAILVKAIDLQSTDEEGRTALLICGKSHELVQILLKRGAVATGKDFLDIVEMSHYENQRAHANRKISGKEWAVPEMLIEQGVLASLSAEEKNEALAMCVCTDKGSLTTAQKLIEHGADVNATVVINRKYWTHYIIRTPLTEAIQCGNTPLAELFVDNGASVDTSELVRRYPKKAPKTTGSDHLESDIKEPKKTDKDLFETLLEKNKVDKKAAFTAAVSQKNGRAIDVLLAHGLTVEPQEALIAGIRANHIPLIESAFERGADIHARDEQGRTCLMIAVGENAKEATLNLLIQRGAKVNDTDSEGITPLIAACARRSSAKEKEIALRNAGILLKQCALEGEDQLLSAVNAAENRYGATPLMCAAYDGNETLVFLLIEHGADMRKTDKEGKCSVYLAAERGHEALVALLLCKEPAMTSEAIKAAINKGKKDRVVALLAQPGVDRTTIDFNQALRKSAAAGNSEMVCYLIDEQKAEVDATDESGVTALELAASAGSYGCVSNLLDRGASLTFKGKAGMTPLMCAVMQKEKELVQLLAKRGSQEALDAQNDAGETALLMCLKNGCGESIVKALVEAGARPDIADNEGKSPLTMVKGHAKALKYLNREITHEEMLASDDKSSKEDGENKAPSKPKRCDWWWIFKSCNRWWNKEKKD